MLALALLYSTTNPIERELDFTKNKEWKFFVRRDSMIIENRENKIKRDKGM